MIGTFVISELKKWIRDPLLSFMLLYPLVIGLIGRYGLPIFENAAGMSFAPYTDIVLVLLALLTPQIFGALLGFSILDDRDDHILTAVQVTPLSVWGFLLFRVFLVSFLSFGGTLFIIWFTGWGDLTFGNMAAVSFLVTLGAPVTGLLINATANNKIEGFVAMKGVISILLIFPVVSLFFLDAKELFFALTPGFWPAKVISALVRGEGILRLTLNQYYWWGLAYAVVLNFVLARALRIRLISV